MAEALNERPAPAAIGTLATRPLVHLLVYARNRRLTGELAVEAPDGRSGTLELWRGQLRGARTVPAVSYFGALAYELGLIDTSTLDATLLEIAKTKKLHGEVLVERGALTSAQRDSVLSEQICRKVHHLFEMPPESTFAFYDAPPGAREPVFTLDPIKPAWRGLRESPPTESMREVIERFTPTPLRMANEGPVERAGLDPQELALCDALTWRPMTIAQMRAESDLPAARVDLLIYLLVITKCAEPAPASSPALAAAAVVARPMPGSSPSLPAARPIPGSSPSIPVASPYPAAVSTPRSRPAMPAPESGEMRRSLSFRVPSSPAFRAATGSSPRIAAQAAPAFSPADLGPTGIAHRAQQVASEDAFTALGLPDGASIEAARAAFFRLSKLWHPDRLPADLAPFSVEVQKIFEHMTRAHHTLTDAEARREYLASGTASSRGSGAPAEKRPRADVLREIEQALAKREFETVEAAASQLAKADPDDAEAQALAAWASTSAGEASEEKLRAALPLLDRAVTRDRHCERAIYFRGVMHKRLGDNVAAFKDFSRVVQLNPKHVDAQREVRIYEMRARKGSGEHALDALISKVKKK